MKKLIICLLTILILLSFGGLTSVHAGPSIEVEGFVDVGSVTDSNALTTTFDSVTYIFNVTHTASWSFIFPNSDGEDIDSFMELLSLEFEADVFASLGPVVPTMPVDWGYSFLMSGSGNQYVLGSSLGTLIGEGEQLTFFVEDVEVYNAALTDDALWQEGQMWGQSWVAGDTFGGGDGGSTSLFAIAPEPISFILFVIGGVFFTGRRYLRIKH